MIKVAFEVLPQTAKLLPYNGRPSCGSRFESLLRTSTTLTFLESASNSLKDTL